jgi:photosystem II stability/assembly factor-like uncharacterized protein
MKQLKLSCLLFIALLLTQCTSLPSLPESAENFENEEGGKENENHEDSLRNIYLKELYFAAPSTNVDSIRYENWKNNYALKQSLKGLSAGSRTSFANGLISGDWHERGPTNEAGDMREVDFIPSTEALYALSTEGHLWKGNLNGITWNLLNDDIKFETNELEAVPNGAGTRIFAMYGTGIDDKVIRYSDDEGQSWTKGTGFSFYDHFGEGRRLFTLSDDQTLYYLVRTWQGSPWGCVFQLYKSTDKGLSYSKIWNSAVGYSDNDVDFVKIPNSDNMYLVDNREQKYYKVTHNFGTGAGTISAATDFSAQGMTKGQICLTGRFNTVSNDDELFLYQNTTIYKALYGAAWTNIGTSPSIYRKAWLANPNTQSLYLGAFQVNTSNNGANWTEKYPQWWEYYKDSPTKKDSMHVDIMDINYFKKSNGAPFMIILNHSGIHVTYNNFQTTQNLGLNNLNVVTLYDISTASDGFLYFGAQDKGNFKYGGNSKANFNLLSSDNMSTADGMKGVFFNNDLSFYAMIQNGGLYCFKDRNVASAPTLTIPGTDKPGWINPMVATPDPNDNKAYVAGGNINGGSGSYLITANVILSPFSWQNTQFNYDFKANSNNGASVIKAIGTAKSDYNRIFVATQDATFFSTINQGVTWVKQLLAGLPATMIPWDIKTSNTNANKVFVCGTGFSNSGVYQSNDAGQTFFALSGAIPSATFYEIALSDSEQVLYAATSSGPYAYLFSTGLWYSLIDANTPLIDFRSVENIGNNVIRFGTYGRGVWDLAITQQPLPVSFSYFSAKETDNQQVAINWNTEIEVGIDYFEVEKSVDGIDFFTLRRTNANNKTSRYEVIDPNPKLNANNYYRIKSVEKSGKIEYTNIEVIRINRNINFVNVYPTALRNGKTLFVDTENDNQNITIFDTQGKIIFTQNINKGINQLTLPTTSMGFCFYSVSDENKKLVKSGKIFIGN